MNKSLVVACSGNARSLETIAKAFQNGLHEYEVKCVVADRECGAVDLGRRLDLNVMKVAHQEHESRSDYNERLNRAILAHSPDLLLLYFDRLVDTALISAMQGKVINTHYALLPAFPGFGAIKGALKRGCRFSGVTLHYADEGVDTGPILAQAVCPVFESDTEDSLGKKLFQASLPLTLAALSSLPDLPVSAPTVLHLKDGSPFLASLPVSSEIRSFLADVIL